MGNKAMGLSSPVVAASPLARMQIQICVSWYGQDNLLTHVLSSGTNSCFASWLTAWRAARNHWSVDCAVCNVM
eukprot:6587649-Pyramimonas_sp.AAC.1